MKIRNILLYVCLFFVVSSVWSQGGEVVVVVSRTLAPYQEALKGFEHDGRFNAVVINLEGDATKTAPILEAVQNVRPEAVLAFGTDAVNAVKNISLSLPIVYAMVLEPVDFQGKKVSGIVIQIPPTEQFSRISKMLPGVKRVGVLYNPNFSKKAIAQARETIGQFNMMLIPIAIENPSEISGALSNLTKDKVDAIWSVVDNMVAQPMMVGKTIEHSQNQKIPFIGLSVFHVKAGALSAFSVDYSDVGRQASELVAKVITDGVSGKVETPKKIVVFVNEVTQRQLNVELSKVTDVQFVR